MACFPTTPQEELQQSHEKLGLSGDGDLPLEVGIDFEGRGAGFVVRGLGQPNPQLGSVQVAVAEVPRGALVQLHVSERAGWLVEAQCALRAGSAGLHIDLSGIALSLIGRRSLGALGVANHSM